MQCSRPLVQRKFSAFGAGRRMSLPLAASSQQSLDRLNRSAKSKVLELITEGALAQQEDMEPALRELLYACPIKKEETAMQALGPLGQGTWEVFHAPHISRMSSVLGAKFSPIIYKLQGDRLTSNVKYSHPLLGMGWLSAGGSMARKYDDTVEVKFDRFWIDGPETLREDISVSEASPISLDMDAWMSKLGKGFFFPQLALFPIHYLDNDLCVFEFPPLQSKISVRKIYPPALTA